MAEPYILRKPKDSRKPILISVPHCGTEFPTDLVPFYQRKHVARPEDTDWFVHELYHFATEMGITLIHGRFSRYVIDLNRDPEGRLLYGDARRHTELLPLTSFSGENLYEDKSPTEGDREGRLEKYYWPYYQEIRNILKNLQTEFRHVLLFEAHSIKRTVSSIREEPFPDLILGDREGKTAHPDIIDKARDILGRTAAYTLTHNDPFNGGHLTRYFGNPQENQHSLQLEMVQSLYMDEERCRFLPERANQIRPILRKLFLALSETLEKLP